jgi:heptosyltransferase-2
VPPRLHVGPEEQAVVLKKLALGPATAARLAINAGAEYGPAKRWPAEYFVETALEVSARQPVEWLVLGGPADEAIAREIAARIPGARLLAGRTSLRDLMAVLAHCRLMLTNDTGPMHVAAAVGTPVVGLFGPTEPRRTGPYGQVEHVLRLDLPCVPCMSSRCRHKPEMECLTSILPDRAFGAVRQRLVGKIR